MNRRTCCQSLLAATALASASRLSGAATAAPSSRLPRLGVQLFPVRSLLQKDVPATLKSLAAIGYVEIEMFGLGGPSTFASDAFFGMKPAEFKKLANTLGLTLRTAHFSGTEEQLPQIAALALDLGVTHLIRPMAPDFQQRTAAGLQILPLKDAAQLRKIADDLNRLGRICQRSGIGFAYHNHDMEFAQIDGQCAYDTLLAATDPGLVRMELDIGWAKAAGIDGADYLERYPQRFVGCHLKDFNPRIATSAPSATAPIPAMVQMVPPGEGVIDFKRIFAAMRAARIEHGYLEVDLPVGDPLDVCRRGYQTLSRL